MKPGKVSEFILKRAVIKQLQTKYENVMNGAAIGNDAALFVLPENKGVVTATETIVDELAFQKSRAIIRAVNNVYAGGGIPKMVSLSIMLPTSCIEADLRALFKECVDEAKKLGLTITGGHTEVSEYVQLPIVSATVTGYAMQVMSVKNIKAGQDIVLSKSVGLEGAYLLAGKHREFFETRFSDEYISRPNKFIDDICIDKEATVAMDCGVTAMHDLAESGLFGALWEMGEAAGVGISVDIKSVNIQQETIELCEYFDINPYKIQSSGALLMVCDDGAALVEELATAGVTSSIIGKITDGNDRVIVNEDETRFLEPPRVQTISLERKSEC